MNPFLMKEKIFSGLLLPSFVAEISLTALRIFTGLSMALAHGFKKVPVTEAFIDYVAKAGFPLPVLSAWAAGLSESVGGILLALGFATRPAAILIFLTMAGAALVAHANDPFQKAEMAYLYGFISLVFAALGGGQFSIDRLIRR